jgi:sulfotransferase family protein
VSSVANDRPIFVTGCPRSGTTMLQLMLHSHPRIAIPPETRFVLSTYRHRLHFGDLEIRANRRELAKFILRRGHKFRDLGLDRWQTRRQIVLAPPTLGSAIGTVFRAYADRFDRPRWGDKWPAYHRYLEIVVRLFPDAHIVHIVRDPRDCVASLKRMPWWNRSVYHSMAAWAQAVDHTEAASRRWPGSVTAVQYERLVADPERELRNLAAALGEEYDPQMAEPERIAPVAVPERKHWHANTHVSPTTKAVGRWASELEPWEIALCERVLGERMARYGYERTGPANPRLDQRLRFQYMLVTRKAAREQWLLRDRLIMRRREPNPVAARLTSAQRSLALS